ncbi:MAG: XkdF-like putative serine protease domain-containing protein [Agriterribacter sp.]
MDKLPVYKMIVKDEADGVDAIAFCEFPAIEREFIHFSKDRKPVAFKIQDEEKRIVSGPLLLADTPIYRNEKGNEFYILIEKDEIFKTVQKFFNNGNQSSANAEHTDQFFTGVTLFESFIIDSSRGIKAPEGYGELTEGSWFGSFKVDNDEVWQAVKDGTFKGFSIEGYYSFEPINLSKAEEKPLTPLQELAEALKIICED